MNSSVGGAAQRKRRSCGLMRSTQQSSQPRISDYLTGTPKTQSDPQRERPTHSNNKTNILQWNAYHLTHDKAAELEQLAEEHNLDVICISEFNGGSQTACSFIENFQHPVISENENTKPIAIFFKEEVQWYECNLELPIIPGINVQTVKIRRQNEEDLMIVHVYIHPSVGLEVRRVYWDSFPINELDHIIFLGDFNERSRLFSPENPQKYCSMENIIDRHHLAIINDGSVTRIQFKNGVLKRSAIDWTLATIPTASRIQGWTTIDTAASDHFPILTTLNSDLMRSVQQQWVYKTDYRKLKSEFLKLYKETPGDPGVRFFDTLEKLKLLRVKLKKKMKRCPWWNSTLQELKKQRNKSRRKKDEPRFKTLRRAFRRQFRIEKRKYYRESLRK